MLGAWIDCKNAWTALPPIHNEESERNAVEIQTAVELVNQYPDIIKIIAVGNEAMVNWATSYYVTPDIILKWVNHLQNLKMEKKLPKNLWITSSDNFASWGGAESSYHVEDLTKLIKAVDYVSLHTYPFHDSHYSNEYWLTPKEDEGLSNIEKIDAAMLRAKKHAMDQYQSTTNYIKSLGIDKPIHIGETGWASSSDGLYGNEGSKATDEYKASLFYHHMRDWTNEVKMTCFYFEAFDEQWKDANNPQGSENHFGLFTLDGKAKYALWDLVDQGLFNGLTRERNKISKTYNGNKELLMKEVLAPPLASEKK
jgi:exo-beta-1,3-glucanase (GH17 family)